MEVILLEKVGKLGGVGDKVNVKSGFGRNCLVPQGKAIMASSANMADFEARRAELELAAAGKKESAEIRAGQLAELQVVIAANAGDEGKLFGSIGARDIAEAITKAGVEVTKAEVKLPQGTLREVGEFEVTLQLHVEVTPTVTIVVEAE